MNLLKNSIELICRVCLNSNLDFHDIFSKNESSCTIAFCLMECAPVEIAPEDGLPHQICTECFEKVQYVQQFKSQIVTSDNTLRQYLQNYNDIKPNVWDLSDTKNSEKVDDTSDIAITLNDIEVKEEDHLKSDRDDFGDDISEGNNVKSIKPKKEKKSRKKAPKKQVKEKFIDESDDKKPQASKNKKRYERRRVGGPFKCDECDKTCSTKGNLALHKRTHTGEKPHMCDICGKSFAWGSYLVNHRRTHTGEYMFQCDFCSKQFVYITAFKEHRRIHSSERPYKCESCDKSFKQRSLLRVHKRIHSDVYNYECDTCQKRFKTRSVMIKHKRIHTGEQPYECPLCSKKFSQSASLYNHNRLVHKINSTKPIKRETNTETKIESEIIP